MKNDIKALASTIHPEVVKIRQHLHQHPELSFEEHNTSKFIAQKLKEWDVDYTTGWGGGTGIVAHLGPEGDKPIALRADIDALPITEENNCSYRSQNQGVMHACGHDVHSASLLGTIWVLKQLADKLTRRYRFIFQPGEERLPGGASLMIKDGVLQNPEVSHIFGQHVHPSLPVGKVGVKGDYFMASCDEVFITICGKGGHGAMPHQANDPILIAAELICSLQNIVSRHANPNTPSVLTIGKINSDGGATNVIPEKVMMEGTFRTFDESWRHQVYELIDTRVHNLVKAHGATVELEIKKGYPSLYNNPILMNKAKGAMIDFLGAEQVVDLPQRMTAEDFAYYSQQVPACFYRLGTASANGENASPVHTPQFDIDEEALNISVGLMSWLAIQTA